MSTSSNSSNCSNTSTPLLPSSSGPSSSSNITGWDPANAQMDYSRWVYSQTKHIWKNGPKQP